MKKSSLLLLGAAGLLMASCSQEDVSAPVANDGNFTVSVQLPEDLGGTRAFGDGYFARDLFYAVYEVNAQGQLIKPAPVTVGEATFPKGSLQTEVSFNLANGKYYQVAFFAESWYAHMDGQEVYTFDAQEGTITVNYANMKSEWNLEDAYDCFYRLYSTGMIGDASTNNSPTVYLYRPVAQINWGTNDYTHDAITDGGAFGNNPAQNITSNFTARLYTKFNFFTSDVMGTPTTQTISAFSVPVEETFPVQGYDYVAMQYVLAPKGENVYDLNLTVNSTVSGHSYAVDVDNAPVQANYRTNIYGSLFTDNFHIYVVKDPAWETPDFDIDMNE